MEYCDDDREYIRVRKTEVAGTGLPKDTMDLLTPISREQLQARRLLSPQMCTALSHVVDKVNAVSIDKSECRIEEITQYIPAANVNRLISILRVKFPGCTVEYVQNEWYPVDANTQRKFTGIHIRW